MRSGRFAVIRAIPLGGANRSLCGGEGLLLPARNVSSATEDLMSNSKSIGAVTVGVECIIPILRVNSVAASIRFYVDVLGFKVDWGGEDESSFASVSRDGRAIMLCQGDQG